MLKHSYTMPTNLVDKLVKKKTTNLAQADGLMVYLPLTLTLRMSYRC